MWLCQSSSVHCCHSEFLPSLQSFITEVVVYCFILYFCLVSPSLHPFLPASQVPVLKPTDLMVEVRPRRVFSNGHTYHVNSISVNSDGETYLSADDLRINMWHLGITDRSFSILPCRNQFCFSVALHSQTPFSPFFNTAFMLEWFIPFCFIAISI